MPSLAPKTFLRLNPSAPLLWRDADCIQLGIDGDVRVDATAAWVEPLLSRMAAGFQRGSFDVIAHAVDAPRAEARRLLARLEPLLTPDTPPVPAGWIESINLSDGRTDYRMREALVDEGIAPGERLNPQHVGVILVGGAVAALHLARYLRDDTTHAPVAFELGRTTIGPVIVPGASPCLACRDAHERDTDRAWPRMHAQLIGRDPGRLTAARVADAATLVAQLLCSPATGSWVIVRPDGHREWRTLTFHEECRCREQSFLSPPGIEKEPVRLVQPNATTTHPTYARRA